MSTASTRTKTQKVYREPLPQSGFGTRRQIAEEYGCSESFLAHLPASVLPRYNFGGRVLYDRAEVVAFIKGTLTREMPARPKAPPSSKKRGRPAKPPIRERV